MLTSALFEHRYIPAPRKGEESAPRKAEESASRGVREKVLIVLHGLGDSLEGFTWMPSQLRLEGLSYLLVNAPDDYYGGFSWFDFTGGGAHMENAVPGILRSRKLIKGLIAEVMAQGVEARDILLFGFSQGCLMALDAGLRSEFRLGGICGVSGWLAFQDEYPAAFSPSAREQAFLVTHGTRDPLLPFVMSKAQCAFLKEQGVDVTFKAYDKDHTILPEELRDIREWLSRRLRDGDGAAGQSFRKGP